MDSPFIGSIVLFAGNFPPRGWAFCQGQILAISTNTALFSILGTTYGGNGQTTFALPDLRGRTPIGQGQGPGLSPVTLGEMAGVESVTLITSQIPMHNHLVQVSTATADQASPSGNFLASPTGTYGPDPVTVNEYTTAATQNATLAATSILPAGGSLPHENRQPFLGLNYIIALQGIFPSRN
jgi:microcystin-dependent protein